MKICWPIWCAACWRTAPTPPSSIGLPTTKRRSQQSSPIRSRRRRGRAEGQSADPAAARSIRARAAQQSRGWPLSSRRCAHRCCAQSRIAGDPRRAAHRLGQESRVGGEISCITSPHDRSEIVGACRSADRRTIGRALPQPRPPVTIGTRRAARPRAHPATAPPICSRQTGPAHGADGARGRQDTCECAGRFPRGDRSSSLLGRGSAPELCCAARAQGTDRREERALAARPRRVRRISPWNFPLAIFTGQIAGALAAGNAVVAKPAEQTPLIAARAVRLMLSGRHSARRVAPGSGRRRDRRRGSGRRSAH